MFSCGKDEIPEEVKRQQNLQTEINLFSFYDLQQYVNYKIFDVDVRWGGVKHVVHTFQGSRKRSSNYDRTFVLLHGYGGSNVHYSRMYKDLIKEAQVYSIDLPGMGFSSKENINITNYEDTIEYFTGIIELWRESLGINNIYLIGHSFGGYIATHYAIKYPQYIQQLFLLSPAGTTYYTQEEIVQLQDHSNETWLRRTFLKIAKYKWNQQITPQDLSKRWYGNMLVNRYLSKRMQLKGSEFEVWKAYTDACINQPQGSEKALFILFDFPRVISLNSIEELLTESKLFERIPVNFYYGRQDWMDKKGCERLNEKYPDRVNFRIIESAGHQLNFENPKLVVQFILEDLRQNISEIQLQS